MMKLYLIRHGESESNAAKLWTGWFDSPLTKNGIKDAEGVRAYLHRIHFDQVYSSDLIRAYQTAQVAIPGCKPEKTALLREINVGSLAGTPLANTSHIISKLASAGYADYGGESQKDFQGRLRQFLCFLEQQNFQSVAAFAHAGCMRIILDTLVGNTIPRNAILCRNCCIAIFEYDGSTWKLHSWINTQ